MHNPLDKFLDGDYDLTLALPDAKVGHNLTGEQYRDLMEQHREERRRDRSTTRLAARIRYALGRWYRLTAVLSCLALMAVFLYMTANISLYGQENPRATVVSDRYIARGVEETGAINAVAGLILDYRAFDTLGESHVLFTALVCTMILLRRDSKNMRTFYEDYYRIQQEAYYPTEQDPILRTVAMVLSPCILLFGLYILLMGHLGPGGGFAGGAVLGAGLMILASAFGDHVTNALLTQRRFHGILFAALAFYSIAKGYVFFMGANHLENHIPKGTPGEILSAGLILPLDIAVGIVVACTMFGFYSLFRTGSIGLSEQEPASKN